MSQGFEAASQTGLLAGKLSKDCIDRRLLHVREEVAIPPSHLVCCMTNKVIDDALVNALRRQIADEAVPQAMPTLDFLPLATL